MDKDQKGFIVYGDIKEVIDELPDDQTAQLFRGMVNYFVEGKDPKFSGSLKYIFIPIRQQMDRNADKYEKKCEKMRENANRRWKNAKASNGMQLDANDANTKTNTDTNTKKDTDTDTDTDTMSPESDAGSLSLFLIDYLNKRAGTSYEVSGSVRAMVGELLDMGYSQSQMRTVIDKKCAEWLNDEKMRGYLRPSTLFGDKFSEYLNAPIPLAAEREKKRTDDRAALQKQLSEKQQALSDLRDALPDADKTERRLLREQIAILEDSIGIIERRLA